LKQEATNPINKTVMEHQPSADRHRMPPSFKDKALEQEFKLFYEQETKKTIRWATVLGLIYWSANSILLYFIVQGYSLILSAVIPFILFPPFLF